MSKSVLCVFSYFPPDAATGTHRARAIARFLPESGWRPVVVSPALENGASRDEYLLEGLPADLVTYRTPAPSLLSLGTRARDWLRTALPRKRTALPAGAGVGLGGKAASRGSWTDWASWWL